MALTNMDKRRPNLVSKRGRTVERERREEEKREKEEEEEKKRKMKRRRREEEVKPRLKRYGTTKLEYESLVCMIFILPKPRVLLGFHPKPLIMESKVDKTLKSTRSL